MRPYICDGGATGYGVRRDTEEDEEEDAEAEADEVLALAARARADAALMSLDAYEAADEFDDDAF